MSTVAEVIRVVVAGGGRLVSEGSGTRVVSGVSLVEDDALIDRCAPGSVAVLSRAAAASVLGFRVDALLARAAHRGVALVLLPTAAIIVPPRFDTAIAAVGVVTVGADADLGALIVDLARTLAGGDPAALVRAQQGLEVLERASRAGVREPEAMAERLRAVLPELELGQPSPERLAVASADPARPGQVWSVPDRGAPHSSVDALLLRALEAVSAASAGGGGTAGDVPERALSSVITELLVSRTPEASELVDRSRLLGFDPDGWHTILAVTLNAASASAPASASVTSASSAPTGPASLAGSTGDAGLDGLRREEMVRLIALRTARTPGATWRWARVGTALLLVCSSSRDLGRLGEERIRATATAVFEALMEATDAGWSLACGLSRTHRGVSGLRLAAAEARSSQRLSPSRVPTANSRTRSTLTVFDEFGLDQALLDWFSLAESQESARRLLAPLRALPGDKAELLMTTLQSYLDNQGSITATAAALFVHRNAVTYRMNRIRTLLGTDLADPEERLALQLACRGRHLLPQFSAADR
jgi:hypothetical protein